MLNYVTDTRFLVGLAVGYFLLSRLLGWLMALIRPS